MTFNFLDEDFEPRQSGLFAILLGISGAGKSYAIGTYPGKVLHLTGPRETHGIAQSKKCASTHPENKVIGVRWDRLQGRHLTPDESINAIRHVWLNPDNIKAGGFDCIAIDGMLELVTTIMETNMYQNFCTTQKGGFDAFRIKDAIMQQLHPILLALNNLYTDHEIDIVATSIIDTSVADSDGSILVAKPDLIQYSVAKTVILTFPDILPIGAVVNKRNELIRAFQFQGTIKSISKDEKKSVKRFIDFTPRVGGFTANELPEKFIADLSQILEAKKRGSMIKPKVKAEEDDKDAGQGETNSN